MEVCPSPDGWRVAVARVTALERPPSNPGATIVPLPAAQRDRQPSCEPRALKRSLWFARPLEHLHFMFCSEVRRVSGNATVPAYVRCLTGRGAAHRRR
jgi:hypothetical protein